MGYSMAVNLRTKMDPAATLLVCDVNEAAIEKFQQQMAGKGPVEVVKNGKEAATRAVRYFIFPDLLFRKICNLWIK